jgi:hypothetical protein
MNWNLGRFAWIKHLETTTVVAVAIAGACVMIGQGAERYAASGASTLTAFLAPGSAVSKADSHGLPLFNTIDYATTGSIKGQSVVITPCGRQ